MVQEGSLVNMKEEDLEDEGSKTGLLLIYRKGSDKPEKIEPNSVPTGMDKIIERCLMALKDVTIPDALRGLASQEVSGVAIQSRQFAAQQQLAVPLDNLARTRHMAAEMIDELMTDFYDNYRIFRITETMPQTGKKILNSYEVNKFDPNTRTFINDLTEGEYDVVVSEQPMQVTWENSQFTQALELKKAAVAIPDNIIIRHSNLADKVEILEQMEHQGDRTDPLTQAKIELTQAQTKVATLTAQKVDADTRNVMADTVNKRVSTQFASVETAQVLALQPAIAQPADELLQSAGFEDQNAPPAIPQVQAAAAPVVPASPAPAPAVPGVEQSTHPLEPASPAAGARKGLNGGGQ
jgi:hypothetical protein